MYSLLKERSKLQSGAEQKKQKSRKRKKKKQNSIAKCEVELQLSSHFEAELLSCNNTL